MNLITNASDALEAHAGEIRLRTALLGADDELRRVGLGSEDMPPGPAILLEVEDTGRGMDEATLARIFDPFFTTKVKGRGLGLAATVGIVRSHRGSILVRSVPGEGTCFRIAFPASGRPARSDASPPPPDAGAWRAEGEALVADDEAAVRRLIRRVLERIGLVVTECADGATAIAAVRAAPARFRLAVIDQSMPGLSGTDTLAALRAIRPDLPVLLCSGYSADALDAELHARPGIHFLQKPFTSGDFARAVRSLAESASD